MKLREKETGEEWVDGRAGFVSPRRPAKASLGGMREIAGWVG